MPEIDYLEGQVWEYRARPQDDNSLVKIQKIEPWSGSDLVYHVSIVGVFLKIRGELSEISHVPVSKETLDSSVVSKFSQSHDFPDPVEGINIWRENRGGIFTVPLSEAVDMIDDVSSSGHSPPD